MRKTNLLKTVILCILAIISITAFTACFSNGGVDLSAKVYFTVDGEVYARVTAEGYESVKLPNDPVKPGYVFDGWYSDENVWEKPFTDSDVQNATALKVTVYAKWKECTHDYGEWAETIAPTCEKDGQETRTCKVCTLAENRAVDALGHDVHSHDGKAATCEEDGYGEYEYCTRCDYSTKVTVPALGHAYGDVTYVWANDNSTVTATMTCSRDSTHVIEETVKTVKKVTQTKTCETAELSTYTATFKNKAFTAQVKENVVTADKKGHNYISHTFAPTCEAEGYTAYKCTHCGDTYTSDVKPALNHNYGEVVYTWSKDYGTVTATMKCQNDVSHVITETVKTTVTVTPATCETAELSTYTATFENEAFVAQVKENVVTGSALSHDYSAPVYTWTKDYSSVTATMTCSHDGAHVIEETVKTVKTIQAKTCETDEITTYTANFTNAAFISQVKTIKTADKTGHSYTTTTVNPTCEESGYTLHTCTNANCGDTYKDNYLSASGHDYTVTYQLIFNNTIAIATATCQNDINHVVIENVTLNDKNCKKVVTQTATCGQNELSSYIVSFENEVFGQHEFKNIVTKTGGEHSYGDVSYVWANDYSSVSAVKTCKHCKTDVTIETVTTQVTSSQTVSCTQDGYKVYEATFNTTGLTSQTKKVITAEMTGHSYTTTTVAPTCEKGGYTLHTCQNGGCKDEYKDNYVDALGHGYSVTYTPNYDEATGILTSVTAQAVCKNDKAHVISETVSVNDTAFQKAVTQAAACEKEELSTVIVKFESSVLGTYTQAKVKTADKKGHTWYLDHEDTWCTTCDYQKFTRQLTFKYDEENDWYTVSGLTSYDLTDVIIPAHYCGKSVVGIADNAFEGKFNLKSVTFLSDYIGAVGLTSIGANAFDDCTSLTSIVIPDSVTEIGNYAFSGCTALTSIVIPNGVTTIGNYAFRNCTSLMSVTLGTGIGENSIGNSAFYYCTKLYEVVNNSAIITVEELERYKGQSSSWRYGDIACYAKSIHTGESKLSVQGDYVVLGIEVTNGDDYDMLVGYTGGEVKLTLPAKFTAETYVLADNVFEESKITSISIPASVTEIGKAAFKNCKALETVTFENSSKLTKIDDNAFYYCDKLTAISIPASVTEIGGAAFYGCKGLTAIAIPDGVTSIYSNTFCYCEALETVTFGDNSGLTIINNYAFQNCGKLKSIAIPDSVTAIGSSAFRYCYALETVTFGTNSGLTQIGNYAFGDCTSLTSVVIPNDVTKIDNNTFYRCTALETVTFGEGSKLTQINNSAFQNCSALKSIVIPDNVTSIGSQAFRYCSSLLSVTLGSKISSTSFGSYAFQNCTNLIEVVNNSNNITNAELEQYKGQTKYGYICQYAQTIHSGESLLIVSGNYIAISVVDEQNSANNYDKLIMYKGSDTELTLPDKFKYDTYVIGEKVFQGKSSITKVTIPASVTSIGNYAFQNCSALTSIVIPDSVTSIGDNAFNSCSQLKTVTFGENSQLTSIGTSAFYNNTSLTTIAIPASVTSIGNNAFQQCSSLTSVTFGDNSKLETIGDYAFGSCSQLKTIAIPAGVTSIGNYAFYYCSKLTAIAIPTGVTSIGNSAFYNCQVLASVTFGENSKLETIGGSAFSSCSKLTSIVIPASVTEIGDNSFSGCNVLASVTFGENSQLETIGMYAFGYCSALTSIVIPDNVTSIGGGAFSNCTKIMSVTLGKNIEEVGIGSNAFYYLSSIKEVVNKSDNITDDDLNNAKGSSSFGYLMQYSPTVVSESSLKQVGDFIAWCDSSGDKIIGYSGKGGAVTLPDYLSAEGTTYTIGENAFKGNTTITSIVIPKGVTEIGDSAFYGCTNLESVTFEKDSELTTIARNAFRNCSNLKSIVIPDKVTSIGYYAFYYCSSLMSVTLGEGISSSSFGNYAFQNCTNLIEVVNNSQIDTQDLINAYQMWNSYGFVAYYAKTIHSGESTLVLSGDYAAISEGDEVNGYYDVLIAYLGSDTELTLPDKFKYDTYVIGKEVFQYKSITKITIPASVTAIVDYAFQSCYQLQTVTFGANSQLETICQYAFQSCNSLTTIALPASVTLIGDWAFANCSALTEIVIPDKVTSIGSSAFYYCEKLMSVTLGTGIGENSIGNRAFYGCNKLYEVINNSTLTLTMGRTTYGYVAYYAKVVVTDGSGSKIKSSGDFVYLEGTTENTLLGYTGTDTWGELELPANIDGKNYSIASGAFKEDRFTSITIPKAVTSIGDAAFKHCRQLTSVTFEEGSNLTKIGESAFESCSSLTSITIPANVTSIGQEAFFGCSKLATVTFSANSKLTSINSYAFQNCSELTEIVIPDSVETIYSYAFQNCSSLTSVSLGEGVKTINYQAFYGCTSLYQVIDNSTLTLTMGSTDNGYVAYYAKVIVTDGTGSKITTDTNGYTCLAGDTESVLLSYSGTATALTLPDTLGGKPYDIGSKVFQNSSITSVTIPDAVTSIGDYAFYGCKDLTSVTFGENSKLSKIGNYAFQNCDSLTSIDFGTNSKLETIGMYAFSGCSMMSNITIPASVTSVGSSAFVSCSMLQSLSFGDNVTVGTNAFVSCSMLTEITFGANVKLNNWFIFGWSSSNLQTLNIGKNATIEYGSLYSCNNLKTINFAGTYEEWQACPDTTGLRDLSDYTVNCTDGTVDRYGNFTANT